MENPSQLKTKAEQKARTILKWIAKGCLSYRVSLAESPVQDFIGAHCVKADGLRERFGDLYRAYLDWHDANMVTQPMLKKRFGEIVGRQFKVYRAGGNTFVNGLKLKESSLVAEGL